MNTTQFAIGSRIKMEIYENNKPPPRFNHSQKDHPFSYQTQKRAKGVSETPRTVQWLNKSMKLITKKHTITMVISIINSFIRVAKMSAPQNIKFIWWTLWGPTHPPTTPQKQSNKREKKLHCSNKIQNSSQFHFLVINIGLHLQVYR